MAIARAAVKRLDDGLLDPVCRLHENDCDHYYRLYSLLKSSAGRSSISNLVSS